MSMSVVLGRQVLCDGGQALYTLLTQSFSAWDMRIRARKGEDMMTDLF